MDYQIQKGDSLWQIVKSQYGLTDNSKIQEAIQILAQQNDIEDTNMIYAGQSLKLPDNLFDETETAAQTEETTIGTAFDEWVNDNVELQNSTVEQIYALEGDIDYSEAIDKIESEYVAKQEEIGSFAFTNDDINNDDGTVDKDAYLEQGKEFAESLLSNMDTDNSSGISFAEYRASEIAKASDVEIDELAEEAIKKGFEMFDLNDDGVIDAEELQGVYSVIDTLDNDEGRPDGKIDYDTYAAAFSSDEVMEAIKQNAVKFNEKMAN